MALNYSDLYEGRALDAWKRTVDNWDVIDRSLICQVQLCKIRATHVRGRAALAVLSNGDWGTSEKRLFEREVRGAVAALVRTRAPWAVAVAGLLMAGLANCTGDRDSAVAHLDSSIEGLDGLGMVLYAACARRFRGRLIGGDVGAAEMATQDLWMKHRAVVEPASMMAMLVPG